VLSAASGELLGTASTGHHVCVCVCVTYVFMLGWGLVGTQLWLLRGVSARMVVGVPVWLLTCEAASKKLACRLQMKSNPNNILWSGHRPAPGARGCVLLGMYATRPFLLSIEFGAYGATACGDPVGHSVGPPAMQYEVETPPPQRVTRGLWPVVVGRPYEMAGPAEQQGLRKLWAPTCCS